MVELAAGEMLNLGQQVRIVPNHAGVILNLADELVAVEAGSEPRSLPVDARGRSR